MINTKVQDIVALVEQLEHKDAIDEHHAQIAKEIDALIDSPKSSLQGVHLALSDYLEAVKMVINDTFDHEVWVRAEVQALTNKGGHCYFELAEKNEQNQIVASCRGTLWRYRAQSVLAKFHQVTGRALSAGTSILVKVSANFHAQYGFSLNISDIDPTYTIGELAAAYHAMLKRLHDEGLTELNKSLPAPFDIRQVIVIAPENAAGLGDFRREADRLEQTGACHFHYHHATFQGNHAPAEIRTALMHSMTDFIKEHDSLPDLIVIIRGGGAVGDLAYLNDYELAALIAEQPVPVWVGIGHERDKVLIDEVAHTRFDTPSKVINAIERQLIHITQNAKSAMQRIENHGQKQLAHSKTLSNLTMQRTKTTANKLLQFAKNNSQNTMDKTKLLAVHQLDAQKTRTQAMIKQQQALSSARLMYAKQQIRQQLNQHKSVMSKLELMREHCRYLQSMILIQHPAKTLAKGYALIHQGERIISSAKQLKPNQNIRLEFHDGSINATTDKSSS